MNQQVENHRSTAVSLGWYRFAVVGTVVFLANAGLLVLQLVAGKLLSPFVGSSLETWTSIIGVFLTGIALGNAVGARLADRWATPLRLALILILGSLAALWMIALPMILRATEVHQSLGLLVRIPVLAGLLCLPAGFVLSLPTAPAIRLGLEDDRFAGRVAGSIFALSTLGCLVGNYLTGFVLIPAFTINSIVIVAAMLLVLTAGAALLIPPRREISLAYANDPNTEPNNPKALPFVRAAAIVFLCSFAGMTLELTASRVLAQNLGVSLFTWTGIIGVMLAGTATGNWLGGRLADSAEPSERPLRLGMYLVFAGFGIALSLILYAIVLNFDPLRDSIFSSGPILRVVLWTFILFFLPMFLLGTISPQVIRLTIPKASATGRTAGRVYAWSTAGAIVGTFAAGFVLISGLGMFRTILFAALLPALALLILGNSHKHNVLLYGLSILIGGAVTGIVRLNSESTGVTLETNYFTIRVTDTQVELERGLYVPAKQLQLDYLIHSTVVVEVPTFFYYPHEQIQLEFLRALAKETPSEQHVLVIGGGGYTFPRGGAVSVPTAQFDVVEIDPGVTQVAYSHLGLDPNLPIRNFNLDGRQFLDEPSPRSGYDLITLDAVNDLSVPGHLLTKECNEAVKRNLKPNGIYLVTVIDILEYGRLWKAVHHTLKQSFAHVELLTTDIESDYDPKRQKVYCLYASDRPLDLEQLRLANAEEPLFTNRLPVGEEARWLATERIILTDQYAPTDNMMSGVFLRRKD